MCVEQIECDTAVGKWYKMLGSDTLNAYELQIASLFIRSESIRNTRISLNRLHFKLESFGVRPKRRIRMVKIVSTSRVLVAFFVCAHRHCRRCRCLFIFVVVACLSLLAVVYAFVFCLWPTKSTTFVFLEQSTQNFDSVGYVCSC